MNGDVRHPLSPFWLGTPLLYRIFGFISIKWMYLDQTCIGRGPYLSTLLSRCLELEHSPSIHPSPWWALSSSHMAPTLPAFSWPVEASTHLLEWLDGAILWRCGEQQLTLAAPEQCPPTLSCLLPVSVGQNPSAGMSRQELPWEKVVGSGLAALLQPQCSLSMSSCWPSASMD